MCELETLAAQSGSFDRRKSIDPDGTRRAARGTALENAAYLALEYGH